MPHPTENLGDLPWFSVVTASIRLSFQVVQLQRFDIDLTCVKLYTLPETNKSHVKMDGWNTSFLLGTPIFRGELLVSGRVNIGLETFER